MRLLAGTEGSNTNVTNSIYSAYVSDVLNITPAFIAMVSLRADYFDSKKAIKMPPMMMATASLPYRPS